MIEARLSVFNRLLRLSGRLDIVLSQVSQHASNNRGALGSGPKVLAAGAWAFCRSGTCGVLRACHRSYPAFVGLVLTSGCRCFVVLLVQRKSSTRMRQVVIVMTAAVVVTVAAECLMVSQTLMTSRPSPPPVCLQVSPCVGRVQNRQCISIGSPYSARRDSDYMT